MSIIGRKRELKELEIIRQSTESEFVMVYGRRRVGKTYLIREFFQNKFDFYMTGIAKGTRVEQLTNFHSSLIHYSDKWSSSPVPSNWFEAFDRLKILLDRSKNKRKVVFIDELPWIDTAKSDCVKALEHFWNSWASARKDIVLIVCGSAASWMVKNIVKNRGGLHNRMTYKIKLSPFTLRETEEYLSYKGIQWERDMIVECYMVLGGIPYYLKLLEKSKSLAQNIDNLFFNESALLGDEFENLYSSLFKHSGEYVKIVESLSRKKSGFSRDEISRSSQITNGGGLTRKLEELEECGFIRSYKGVGSVRKMYQLSDFYSIFYFQFIKKGKQYDENVWMNLQGTHLYSTWTGLSFERVCMAHLPEIKEALGISGISTNMFSYYSNGVQIDAVIDRGDKIVSMCEMKYSKHPFTISKSYAEELKKKKAVLAGSLKRRKAIYIVMVTSTGLKHNEYSLNLIENQVTIDDLYG